MRPHPFGCASFFVFRIIKNKLSNGRSQLPRYPRRSLHSRPAHSTLHRLAQFFLPLHMHFRDRSSSCSTPSETNTLAFGFAREEMAWEASDSGAVSSMISPSVGGYRPDDLDEIPAEFPSLCRTVAATSALSSIRARVILSRARGGQTTKVQIVQKPVVQTLIYAVSLAGNCK